MPVVVDCVDCGRGAAAYFKVCVCGGGGQARYKMGPNFQEPFTFLGCFLKEYGLQALQRTLMKK